MVKLICPSTGVAVYANDKRAQALLKLGYVEAKSRSEFPDMTWKAVEITQYAADNGISLNGIIKKQDMLDAIHEALSEE